MCLLGGAVWITKSTYTQYGPGRAHSPHNIARRAMLERDEMRSGGWVEGEWAAGVPEEEAVEELDVRRPYSRAEIG